MNTFLQSNITGHKTWFGKEACENEVLIDSTVQEKNITFPTDSKLHKRIINNVNRIALLGVLFFSSTFINAQSNYYDYSSTQKSTIFFDDFSNDLISEGLNI